jgi:glutathione S-transferase
VVHKAGKFNLDMIELIQFPWSPYCIVQNRILEYSGTPFKIINIPNQDRSLVWKLTKHRYYSVPIIRDGRYVVFEMGDDSQVITKYLDQRLQLGLFPFALEGVQSLLWHAIENDIEGATFRLNDIYWKENVPAPEHLDFLRFKERKFGRGCIDQWLANQNELLKQLEQKLLPFEEMLAHNPFLLGEEPRFVDFDLFGMLENYLYSGHYELPAAHPHVKEWHQRLAELKIQRAK